VNEVLTVFSHDGPLGTVNSWLVLPLLPALLAYGSHRCNQRALMSLNVLLKTDESQCATLSALPDRSWIRPFVAMALIGERGRLESLAKADELAKMSSSASAPSSPTMDTFPAQYEAATAAVSGTPNDEFTPKLSPSAVPVSMGKSGLMTEADWRADAEVAATSIELALDAVSTVLESKMRYSGESHCSHRLDLNVVIKVCASLVCTYLPSNRT
jgi:hypothetical protein